MKNALEMINSIDDEMILSAMETPKASKKTLSFKKLRWTAVAACLALLVSVPVMAEVLGLKVEFNPETNAWKANAEGRFAANEYSKEIRSTTGQKVFISESLEDAEKLIGIDFPENAVLENAEKYYVNTEFLNGKAENGDIHCLTHAVENKGNFLGTHTMMYFNVKAENDYANKIAEVIYSTVCEENPNENAGGFGISFENESAKESYVNPFGKEFEIVVSCDDYGNYSLYAFGESNRFLITISVNANGEFKAREILYKVIDAYK